MLVGQNSGEVVIAKWCQELIRQPYQHSKQPRNLLLPTSALNNEQEPTL